MRNLILFYFCIATLVFCSCSNELASVNDCPTEDSEIEVDILDKKDYRPIVTVKKDNKTWEYELNGIEFTTRFYDVNFDGFTDILFLSYGTVLHTFLVWSAEDGTFLKAGAPRFPIFSPSEKVIYSGSIEEAWERYDKYSWKDGEFKQDGQHLIEVLSKDKFEYYGHEFIKTKYSLAHYDGGVGGTKKYVEDFSCDDFSELPKEWQEAISKMKNDYEFDRWHESLVRNRINKRNKEQQEKDSIAAAKEAEMKRAAEMAYKIYRTDCDNVWIDMGVTSDNGEALYWATSDLIIRKDMTFGLSEFGTFGYKFGWGDITGIAKSTDYIEYGGTNPPSSISGNSQYDIVAAHLNYPARLPSFTEWKKLCENCTYNFMSIDAGEFGKGDGGLPAWVQGQWMAEARIPQIGGDALVSLSVRIAGSLSSVIVTNGGQVVPIYDGVYDYSMKEDGVGELLMGKFRLLINEENKIIVTETGDRLRKINNEGKKQYGLLLTSKINGNRLFFPLPDAHQVVRDGNYAFEFESSQENSYWSGTINKENNKEAWAFSAKGSKPQDFGLGYATRYTKKCIRPVTTTPVIVTIGTTKINNGDNDEEE